MKLRTKVRGLAAELRELAAQEEGVALHFRRKMDACEGSSPEWNATDTAHAAHAGMACGYRHAAERIEEVLR